MENSIKKYAMIFGGVKYTVEELTDTTAPEYIQEVSTDLQHLESLAIKCNEEQARQDLANEMERQINAERIANRRSERLRNQRIIEKMAENGKFHKINSYVRRQKLN